MMDFANRAVTALIALFCIAAAARAQEASSSTVPTVIGQNGMVVAQESRAARVGIDILQKGGNAVDAAVATGFALAVTYPRAGNLGGGGYMVIHLARENLDTTIDYRETAPAAITRDIFLNEKGDADPAKSRDSALAERSTNLRRLVRTTSEDVNEPPEPLPLHELVRGGRNPIDLLNEIKGQYKDDQFFVNIVDKPREF